MLYQHRIDSLSDLFNHFYALFIFDEGYPKNKANLIKNLFQ